MPPFDEYLSARQAAMVRFAYLLCGDRYEAQDLVQEVFGRLHRRWSRLADVGSLDAYVKKAILRQHLSWRRRRSSTERPVADLPEVAAAARSDLVERDAMWRVLAELPRRQRTVLVLRFYEDLDFSTIAAELGCTDSTARAHASHGLARLRAVLSPQEADS